MLMVARGFIYATLHAKHSSKIRTNKQMLLRAGNVAQGIARPPGNAAKGVGHSDLKDTWINIYEKWSFEAAAFRLCLCALSSDPRVKSQSSDRQMQMLSLVLLI